MAFLLHLFLKKLRFALKNLSLILFAKAFAVEVAFLGFAAKKKILVVRRICLALEDQSLLGCFAMVRNEKMLAVVAV
jgi:hypothetical protein